MAVTGLFCASLVIGACSAKADLNDGLIAYWKFDNGLAQDETDNHNNLTAVNNPTGAVGVGGIDNTALNFEADNSQGLYIDDASQTGLDFTGDYSVSFWVNFESSPMQFGTHCMANIKYKPNYNRSGYRNFFHTDDDKLYSYYYVGDGHENVTECNTNGRMIDESDIGQWNYFVIAVDADGKNIKFYKNGILASSTCSFTGADWIKANSEDFVVAANKKDGGYFCDAKFDEYRVYNRTLTPEEVEALYELDKPQAPAPDINNGLIAYWPLDNNEAIDLSGYGNNLTNYGAKSVRGVDGIDNTAFDFERPSGDYMGIADNAQNGLDITGDMTLSAWVRPDNLPGDEKDQAVIAKWNWATDNRSYMMGIYGRDGVNNFYICISPGGKGAEFGSKCEGWSYPFESGKWYYLVVAYDMDQGSATGYINNVLLGTVTGLPTTVYSSNSDVLLGKYYGTGGWYDGAIDEARIYNRTLTPEEVRALYELDKPPAPAPDNDFTFAHITDAHIGSNWLPGENWKEELSYPRFTDGLYEIEKMDNKPDFILVGGDIVEYARARWLIDYQSIVNSFTAQSGIPVYTVPGNHDRYANAWGSAKCLLPGAGDCDDDLNNYRAIVNIPGPGLDATNYLNPGNPVDYEFEHKGITFIGLDSGADFMPDYEAGDAKIWNENEQGPEGDGLTNAQINALSAFDPETPKIAFFHHPVMTGRFDACDGEECPGADLEDASFVNYRDDFLQFASSSSLLLALTGHTHAAHVFDIDDTEYTGGAPAGVNPLFVQTQSATKDGADAHGYRLVDVEEGRAYPRTVNETGDYEKMVGQLESSGDFTFRVYDPDNLSDYITLKDTTGLSVPYFVASSSGRVIIYDFKDNTAKFAVAGRENGRSGSYDLEARLEGEILPVSAYAGDTGYFLPDMDGEPFLRLLIDPEKKIAKAGLENMEMENIDIHDMLVDWDEVIQNGADGIDLTIDREGDGVVDATAVFTPMPDKMTGAIEGWGELNIIDGSGRITGTINGEPREEIPYGLYDEENGRTVIYFRDGYDNQPFTFRVRGIEDAWGGEDHAYTLNLALIKNGEEIIFRAIDIPAGASSTHLFTIDWDTLASGGDGAALLADNDGDGVFEDEIHAGGELSADEYAAGSPRGLHLRALARLEAAKTGDRNTDKKIDDVLKRLRDSVNPAYWTGDYYLDAKDGKKVFDADERAAMKIKLYLGLDDIFGRKKFMPGFLKNRFGLPASVEEAFEEVLNDLVFSDGTLARTAVEGMPASDRREAAMKKLAEKELAAGDKYADDRPWLAITAYEQAWKAGAANPGHARRPALPAAKKAGKRPVFPARR